MFVTGKMEFCAILLLRILFLNLLEAQRCNKFKRLDDIDPCNYKNILTTNFGPCDGILPGLDYAATAPKVFWPEAREELDYLLIMVDADNPTPEDPLFKYFIIWMVFGIVGECFHDGEIEGFTRYAYEFPTQAFGLHRYQIYVYQQTRRDITFISDNRMQFNFTRFASKFNACLKAVYQIYGTSDFTPTVTQWITKPTTKVNTPLQCGVESFVLNKKMMPNILLVVTTAFIIIYKVMM